MITVFRMGKPSKEHLNTYCELPAYAFSCVCVCVCVCLPVCVRACVCVVVVGGGGGIEMCINIVFCYNSLSHYLEEFNHWSIFVTDDFR